ncbi:DapH/DapD/GlmU-related protein [Mesobacillus zeae]|uniref:UDP-N-acetylglucosamine pyrophosphorylase n=1 Tax=Mesobacillus zeae TaxID=1917180 RepID=A0A398BGN7_9BACI|nr:DapH/DapD/GlmU-related protein [Mesobacillus zeae]RID88804.1 hypothetical protein D1970_00725 [Mesobacillus zeae]
MKDVIHYWKSNGVMIEDPATTFISGDAVLEPGVIICPMVVIKGKSIVKSGSTIDSFSNVINSIIGPDCTILSSTIIDSSLNGNNTVGPYSYLRNHTVLKNGAKLGSLCEINDSVLGEGTKCKHFSYLGHAQVGRNVNIGAGTITCNFDGRNKFKTKIGDHAFLGANSLLVAPEKIGDRAFTGAGSVITKDVCANEKVYGVPAKTRI